MKLLGNFLGERLNLALPGSKPDELINAKSTALAVLRDTVPEHEAEQLATSLMEFASSTEFVKAVNQAVPPPLPGESEEEFVSRAKESIRAVLMKKFGR